VTVAALGLTLAEVRDATEGRLVSGPPERPVSGVSIDSRSLRPGELFVAIAGPRFDGHDFLPEAAERGAVAALVHRDVPAVPGLGIVRVADTTGALADLARHVRDAAGVPVVAVTGSVGKTTTKDMAAGLLEARGAVLRSEGNLNNRYGLPLTLLRLRPEHWAAAVELGMSAAGELRVLSAIARPDVAVVTRVSAVHLEFFGSVERIAEAKAEILEGVRSGGAAVLNGDDPLVRRIGETWGGEILWFGRDRRFDVSAERWRGTAFGMRFDLRLAGRNWDVALPLPGPHFVMNFLAAAAAALRLGVAPEAIVERATRLKAARHRGEVLRLRNGIAVLDDCYNSSPEALEAALVALAMAAGRRKVAFLGDMLELGGGSAALHRRAGEGLPGRADVVAAVGERGRDLLEGARSRGFAAGRLHASADSAAAAAELVEPGDAVLVKGSRGMRMETVVEALRTRFGPEEA
jgi:UDP-N-acetylmuramoyl-tripeptide--D-alanyl-D-alanine ligase